MKSNRLIRSSVLLVALAGALFSATAQDEAIEIKKTIAAPGTTPPVWVNLSGLSGEALQTLQFDLYVQGFNFTNADNAQYLIKGTANGDLQCWATDNISKSVLISKTYKGAKLRRLVHAFADEFVEAVPPPGRKGIAQTRIALNVEARGNSELFMADFDGVNADAVTSDGSLAAGPSCVPGTKGLALCYTSWRLGNAAIFHHDRATGVRKLITPYGNSNLSPAVSSDGRRVAMILSKDGSTDLYVSDINGGNLKRLTRSKEDESGPCWSPDGEWICFATRIKERRVLCKIPAAGGASQVVKTPGVMNPSEPDWSPDGKWIAFTAQMGGFQICVVPAAGGDATSLVAGEDPSWSANSRTLVFVNRDSGRLSLLDVPTKQVKDVARISSGAYNQPSWAR